MLRPLVRYEILTELGLYEGWAHDPEEMRLKATVQLDIADCEVFFFNGAPKHLTLAEYREAVRKLGNAWTVADMRVGRKEDQLTETEHISGNAAGGK